MIIEVIGGHTWHRPLRADWGQVKDEIVHAESRAIFSQHADLRAQLLALADARCRTYWPQTATALMSATALDVTCLAGS